MTVHIFRLVLTAPVGDHDADRLFEAGADDGVIETGPQGHSIGFDREAPSFRDAVLSAIADVRSAGFEVARVEPDELVSASDIAVRVGRSRQSVSTLIAGTRGPGGWPTPVAGNARSALWRWSDVAEWFERFDGSQHVDREANRLLHAVNDLLAARRALDRLEPRLRRRLVRQLVG